MTAPPLGGRAATFGPYSLFGATRRLLDGDKEVRLGGRAFDLLVALVEGAGELVSKDDLCSRVWPGTFVDDSNLKVQIGSLRRSIGDGQHGQRFIETVTGRGYIFVAPVVLLEEVPAIDDRRPPPPARHNLLARAVRLVGRDIVLDRLSRLLEAQRLVTIVGPGGLGKTSVALAVAEQENGKHSDGVWLIDLASVASPEQVVSQVAVTLNLEVRAVEPMSELLDALRGRNLLLVLDNCEHVVDATSELVHHLLGAAPAIRILATSREPLQVAGERVYPLPPLEGPPVSEQLSAQQIARYPAAQLFVERARATMDGFELRDSDAPFLAELCAWLDGLPLAIELLAARTDVFGVRGLASRRNELLALANRGRRDAAGRHRTLTAAFDWSFDLLSPAEQRVFQRLAVFKGGFTLNAAASVAAELDERQWQISDQISSLFSRSLIALESRDGDPRFRLLEPVREYAIAKLDAGLDRTATHLRHARYFLRLVQETATPMAAGEQAFAGLTPELGNFREALGWALGDQAHQATGVALAAACGPFWLANLLYEEAGHWTARALGAGGHGGSDGPAEMWLWYIQGASQFYTAGFTTSAQTALQRAAALAETLGDPGLLAQSLYLLSFDHLRRREQNEVAALAARCEAAADHWQDPVARLIADTMTGLAHMHAGELDMARVRLESAYYRPESEWRRIGVLRSGARTDAGCCLARILWLQGAHLEAAEMARKALHEAETAASANSVCVALATLGAAIAVWDGDFDLALSLIDRLLAIARDQKLYVFHQWGKGLKGAVLAKTGDHQTGIALIRETLVSMDDGAREWRRAPFLLDLAEAYLLGGDFEPALVAANEAMEIVNHGLDAWARPEVFRLRGEGLLGLGRAEEAEQDFQEALTWSRTQNSPSWELRAALCLARLWRDHGAERRASALLVQVRGAFGGDFLNADLKAAESLLSMTA